MPCPADRAGPGACRPPSRPSSPSSGKNNYADSLRPVNQSESWLLRLGLDERLHTGICFARTDYEGWVAIGLLDVGNASSIARSVATGLEHQLSQWLEPTT